MDQSIQFPKRRRIKVNPIIENSKEDTIVAYKKFFYDNLQSVKNRTKALADVDRLYKKYLNLRDNDVAVFTYKLDAEAEGVIQEHFNNGIYQQFTKEIKVKLKNSNNSSTAFLELLLHSLTHKSEQSKQQTQYRTQYLKLLYNCLNDFGLHKYIYDRDSTHKRFNVVLTFFDSNKLKNSDEKILISFDKLKENYLTPYKFKSHLMINGKLIHFDKISSIYITSTLIHDDEIPLLGLKNGWRMPSDNKKPSWLILCGKDETDDLISNPFLTENTSHLCISQKCVDELSKLKHPNFNFKKLIRLTEELNSNMAKGNYFSVSMIIRTIIDHVPPLFGVKKFSEYASNINKPSLKTIMMRLNETARKIGDISLHQQIEKKEVFLTQTQVNVFAELETLLNEIVSEYK